MLNSFQVLTASNPFEPVSLIVLKTNFTDDYSLYLPKAVPDY